MRMGAVVLGFVMSAAAATGASAQVTNQEAPGNLAPTVDPGCIAVADAGVQLAPPDLGLGVRACAQAGDWDAAVELLILMQLRAVYDVARVSDASAHQAMQVLSMQVVQSLPPGHDAQTKAALQRFGKTGEARHDAFCQTVRTAGRPRHDPSWMIQHGMGGFAEGGGDGLVKDFDGDAAWDRILTEYLKCN